MLFTGDMFDVEVIVLKGGEPSHCPPVHLFRIFPKC